MVDVIQQWRLANRGSRDCWDAGITLQLGWWVWVSLRISSYHWVLTDITHDLFCMFRLLVTLMQLTGCWTGQVVQRLFHRGKNIVHHLPVIISTKNNCHHMSSFLHSFVCSFSFTLVVISHKERVWFSWDLARMSYLCHSYLSQMIPYCCVVFLSNCFALQLLYNTLGNYSQRLCQQYGFNTARSSQLVMW